MSSWRGNGGRVVSDLRIVPISFAAACELTEQHHRHNNPPIGHKFSIGLASGDELVGAAIIGRPIARHLDDGLTLEVNRTVVAASVPNGNSMLYGAAWRAAKALGYLRLVTYTQAAETGSSLRAAGWRVVAERPARPGWSTPSRVRRSDTGGVQRTLWEAPA